MSSVKFDLTRFHIPNKLFIDGAWTDSVANNPQSMVSAVNDEVICKGMQAVCLLGSIIRQPEFLTRIYQTSNGQTKKTSISPWTVLPKAFEPGKH